MSDEKVCFVYVTPLTKVTDKKSLSLPDIRIFAPTIPCEMDFLVSYGIYGIEYNTDYSIDINAFFKDELLTKENTQSEFLYHDSGMSATNEYVSTITAPITNVPIKTGGLYNITVDLYRGGLGEDVKRDLLHSASCYFVISDYWIK